MPDAVRRRLALWFTFGVPVGRRAYVVNGALLMAVKYAVDALVVGAATGRFWSPAAYLTPSLFAPAGLLGGGPAWLAPALAAWTLPFLWIGVSMSLRRALDAGWSAWTALLFFVPALNYLYLLTLAALPSREARLSPGAFPASERPALGRLPGALLSIAAGTAVAMAMFGIGVYGADAYGASLFFATPFALGTVTGFLFNRRYPATDRQTIEVAMMTLLVAGGMMIVFALEGAVCLVMALPLAAPVAACGALVGRLIARLPGETTARAVVALLVLPAGAAVERGRAAPPEVEVVTTIDVDAPPAVVWRRVIAFPPLAPPTALIFRLGIAAPTGARIDGSGVGAVRRCEFTTGAFVEPITAWEPGHRLAFEVAEGPDPLRELNPVGAVDAPHLHGVLRSRRGEFLLTALPGGRTRLEGHTWLTLDMAPQPYWSWIAVRVVHRIHRRVLDHVRALAERDMLASPAATP